MRTYIALSRWNGPSSTRDDSKVSAIQWRVSRPCLLINASCVGELNVDGSIMHDNFSRSHILFFELVIF
jgi:hypothetical protein